MLTNMYPPPTDGNFSDNSNHRVKHHIVEWYNQHMGYVDSSDHMANSYSMNRPDLLVEHKITFPNFWIKHYSEVGYCYIMWGQIYPPRYQAPSGDEFD